MTEQLDSNAAAPAATPQAPRSTEQPHAREKRPFVEPSVSVPADVLEATALFQAPTIQTSVVP